jgi:lipoprotein-anchoring transpeptidase ErfK/SrfK
MPICSAILRATRRAAAVAAMATLYLAMGFSLQQASAALPPPGEGLVLVPPASEQAKKSDKISGFKHGKIVPFDTPHRPGTIVVITKSRKLFYVLGNGRAVEYRVATAKKGFEWSGRHKVSSKTKWPDWRPPEEMRKRRPDLPAFMEGGPDNPLGARAIYLGSSIYRIHGTNEPSSIGKAASSGCIRMLNAAVIELYSHVKVGDTVIVM